MKFASMVCVFSAGVATGMMLNKYLMEKKIERTVEEEFREMREEFMKNKNNTDEIIDIEEDEIKETKYEVMKKMDDISKQYRTETVSEDAPDIEQIDSNSYGSITDFAKATIEYDEDEDKIIDSAGNEIDDSAIVDFVETYMDDLFESQTLFFRDNRDKVDYRINFRPYKE